MKYLTYQYAMTISIAYNEKNHLYYLVFSYPTKFIHIKKVSALKIKNYIQSSYEL